MTHCLLLEYKRIETISWVEHYDGTVSTNKSSKALCELNKFTAQIIIKFSWRISTCSQKSKPRQILAALLEGPTNPANFCHALSCLFIFALRHHVGGDYHLSPLNPGIQSSVGSHLPTTESSIGSFHSSVFGESTPTRLPGATYHFDKMEQKTWPCFHFLHRQ